MSLFYIFLVNESEQFAENAQGNEDQDDKFDMMMLETSEASKANDFRCESSGQIT